MGINVARVCHFNSLVPYAWGLQLQEALVATGAPNTILCMQHSHAITIGKRGSADDVKCTEQEVRRVLLDFYAHSIGLLENRPCQLVVRTD